MKRYSEVSLIFLRSLVSLVQQDDLRHQDRYVARGCDPNVGERHPHGWVLSIHPVRTFMLLEEELAQPWGVVCPPHPYAVDRGLKLLIGA